MALFRERGANEERLRAKLEARLGATGQFPEGKLADNDEGEIRVAIGQQNGKVVIDFGKPVAWIGFTPEQAEEIAVTLREHALEARLRR
jgi:hypothetical protein